MSDYANHRLRRPIYVQIVHRSREIMLRAQHSGHAVTEWLQAKVVDIPGKTRDRRVLADGAFLSDLLTRVFHGHARCAGNSGSAAFRGRG
ncbi:hypothetical protein [Paracoccus methylarcula]|uniref:hypothetical protein n=1 Tax=Paracoccus methylarcula TaxID=72022 RepID=UPI0011CDDD12|nr:hypothetical protein [Paracoccus methylarcula]